MIALLSGVAAMAVVGAALGLVPAIEAASGNGAIGTFVVGFTSCSSHRGPCVWVGTFEARGGDVVRDVVYRGSLAPGIGGGSRVPARYPGDRQAYAIRGSHTWAWDLLTMLFIGSLIGFLVWLSPVGLRQRRAGSAAWRHRRPPEVQL